MDFEDEQENRNREPRGWMRLLPLLAAVLIIIVILLVMVLQRRHSAGDDQPQESAAWESTDGLGENGGETGESAARAEGEDTPKENTGAENPAPEGPAEETDPQEPSRQETGSQVDVKQLLCRIGYRSRSV